MNSSPSIGSSSLNAHINQLHGSAGNGAVAALRDDWDNREFVQLISDNVKHIADFLNLFEVSCKGKLAALNDRLATIERKVDLLEAKLTPGETLN